MALHGLRKVEDPPNLNIWRTWRQRMTTAITSLTSKRPIPVPRFRRLSAGALIVLMGFGTMTLGGCASNDAQAGALLGAGLGAIGGAVVGHNSGRYTAEGAAIGAGIGAVTGYIIGNESDKARSRQYRYYHY
jgi:hypothetical protein